jgi:peptidoglycan/LPS O-acetylase OafA/YrhL
MKFRKPNSIGAMFTKIAALTFALLLIPLTAMQFSDSVDWDSTDFVVAGLLIGTTGLGFELLTRSSKSNRAKLIIGIVLGLAFLLVWAELAVGVFGTPFAGS